MNTEPTRLTVDLGESMWDTISKIRDAAPRSPGDADTDEITAALFPVIGRFLRDAAREHMAASRVVDEDLTPTGRALLALKAQALTDLADQIDGDHRDDTVAVFAFRPFEPASGGAR